MTVSVKVSDFAEDIAEPIVPILDALGMIGGDGNDLNLGDWDLNKAIGFIASYQRTSSLLSIFDLIKILLLFTKCIETLMDMLQEIPAVIWMKL